jgi:hypothetical protein
MMKIRQLLPGSQMESILEPMRVHIILSILRGMVQIGGESIPSLQNLVSYSLMVHPLILK